MKIIKPFKSVGGALSVSGDKSISHRAVMLSAIAQGSTRITNFLKGRTARHQLTASQARRRYLL